VEDYGWGLWVEDGSGDVTLTNVTASGNDNGNPDEEWTAGGAHIFTADVTVASVNSMADGDPDWISCHRDVTWRM
jgi:hypothetical protein